MGRKSARERWRKLVGEQAGSGLSVAEFCRRHDLPQASFYQWRRKLRETESATTTAAEAAFVPVAVTTGASVNIELPGGTVIRVPPGDPQSLAQILSLLMQTPERSG